MADGDGVPCDDDIDIGLGIADRRGAESASQRCARVESTGGEQVADHDVLAVGVSVASRQCSARRAIRSCLADTMRSSVATARSASI